MKNNHSVGTEQLLQVSTILNAWPDDTNQYQFELTAPIPDRLLFQLTQTCFFIDTLSVTYLNHKFKVSV